MRLFLIAMGGLFRLSWTHGIIERAVRKNKYNGERVYITYSIWALRRIADGRSLEILYSLLTEYAGNTRENRYAAANAFIRIGDGAVPTLDRALKTGYAGRDETIRALRAIATAAANEVLLRHSIPLNEVGATVSDPFAGKQCEKCLLRQARILCASCSRAYCKECELYEELPSSSEHYMIERLWKCPFCDVCRSFQYKD